MEENPERLRPDRAGRFAWDRWETDALSSGVNADLASLGREIMRRSVEERWSMAAQVECGWYDGGRQMLELARTEPRRAWDRWQHLKEENDRPL